MTNPTGLSNPEIELLARLTQTGEIECSLCERPVVFGLTNPDGPDAAQLIRRLSSEAEGLREALVHADLTIRSFPGADQSHVEFIRAALTQPKAEGEKP